MDTVWFGFVQILGILGDVSVSKLLGFETFLFCWWFRIRFRSEFGYRHTLMSNVKKIKLLLERTFGAPPVTFSLSAL